MPKSSLKPMIPNGAEKEAEDLQAQHKRQRDGSQTELEQNYQRKIQRTADDLAERQDKVSAIFKETPGVVATIETPGGGGGSAPTTPPTGTGKAGG